MTKAREQGNLQGKRKASQRDEALQRLKKAKIACAEAEAERARAEAELKDFIKMAQAELGQ